MDVPQLIAKKRNGEILQRHELEAFVGGVTNGTVEDSQVGAMLMAICLKGMDTEETRVLTEAMRDSGEILSWPPGYEGKVVDKHSTGGVGDKVSLILAPALAACGMKVPMISGRGLGHTGGTLDKLESIHGYNVGLSREQIQSTLDTVGCCITGQTGQIAPADKRLYATRDVTATVANVSLITGSIICKKAAECLDALVLDVKCGLGAWPICSTVEDASELAQSLVNVGNGVGMRTTALITEMDNPLGKMAGNALEVIESIRCLQNNGPKDLIDLVAELGGELLNGDGKEQIMAVIENGEALKKFKSMLKAQGVAEALAENICSPENNPADYLPQAEHTTELKCSSSGYVERINAMTCGLVTRDLGAGRTYAGQPLRHAVGLEFLVGIGSQVSEGDPWVRVHHDRPLPQASSQQLQDALVIKAGKPCQSAGRVLRKILQ